MSCSGDHKHQTMLSVKGKMYQDFKASPYIMGHTISIWKLHMNIKSYMKMQLYFCSLLSQLGSS